jgi:hypothetical protein
LFSSSELWDVVSLNGERGRKADAGLPFHAAFISLNIGGICGCACKEEG